MKRLRYTVRLCLGAVGLTLLFLLNFLYLAAALGLFTLGVVIVPSTLLGAAGVIHVSSDLSLPALLFVGGGIFFLGFGMCLGIAVVCPASAAVLRRFCVGMSRRKERIGDE
ncbi:MAG: hypothetical protein NC084_07370 [Bacteroides sp.]|nr:hypothetical protein [Eubacterium sp.]MCM1418499.1 hypothetical protein [Roseburia sp.]MCM1462518.1 hypothetical protein [Bacteroides sp.]